MKWLHDIKQLKFLQKEEKKKPAPISQKFCVFSKDWSCSRNAWELADHGKKFGSANAKHTALPLGNASRSKRGGGGAHHSTCFLGFCTWENAEKVHYS